MSFEMNRTFVTRRAGRPMATIAALGAAVAAAGITTAIVSHHAARDVAAPAVAPAVDLAAFPAVTCPESASSSALLDSDPIVQQDKARALRLFNTETPVSSARSIQLASFAEFHFEAGTPSDIKEVNVQTRNGDVFVVHDPDPRVVVLAGKRTAAQTYERAREFARAFNVSLKRDGDKVNARVAGPSSQPDDAWGSADCIVIAPAGVKVNTASGQ